MVTSTVTQEFGNKDLGAKISSIVSSNVPAEAKNVSVLIRTDQPVVGLNSARFQTGGGLSIPVHFIYQEGCDHGTVTIAFK